MLFIMRTAISYFDRLANQMRRTASARCISLSTFIYGTLSNALKRRELSEPEPFRLVTVRGVSPRPGVDLNRPRALEAEDDERRFKNTQP